MENMPDKVIKEIVEHLGNKMDAWLVYSVDHMPLINMLPIVRVIKDLKQMRFESAIDYFTKEQESMHELAVNGNGIFEENSKEWILNFLPEKLTGEDAYDFELKVAFWLDYLTNKLVVEEG